jgi:5-methylcytosine-specific restriction endonuclease McrA
MGMDREYFNNRRRERRKKFLALLGGSCERCGSKKDLHFDHKNPRTKKHHISRMMDSNELDIKSEIKKTQLLCADCHRAKTHENWEYAHPQSEHGTIRRYKAYGCRCDKCRKAMSDYYYSKL